MKNKIFFIVAAMGLSFSANAVEIKKDALYCVNSKSIIDFYTYEEQGLTKFKDDLFARSECFVKGKNEQVILKTEQKKYVELELISGFTIWTKKENIIR